MGREPKLVRNVPESGILKVVGNPSTTAPIAKGDTMPPDDKQAVTWELIQYA